jgi:glycosyltransferase involved in cell wall biosynthesis
MLIGIDASRAALGRRTGTETYALHLIRTLIMSGTGGGTTRSGHCFRLYTNGDPPAGLFWEGRQPAHVEVRAIPFPRLWTHLRLSAEMLAHPPDVLFVPSHVLPLIHPRRCVATVHDLGYLAYPDAHRPADRRYLAWSTGWNARQSTLVLADSEATKADLVRAYGVPADKVRVVYLGCDVPAGAVNQPMPRPYPQPYFLYVGTLQPRKNLERLVAAFAKLAADPTLADVKLVLAGRKGWLYDSLFAQVAQWGLTDRVIFPGYVPDEALPDLYRGALAYVFPSLYEGFGLPVLEAQTYGVPVMTANNSSLPEVAGDAALLVDPHDVDAIAAAMRRLATDEALRQDLARRGLSNVKRFSWEKCAAETLAVLEEAARTRND